MQQRTTERTLASRPPWETLGEWLGAKIQLSGSLEEEVVTQLLGRARYQRRAAVDGAPGSRTGYGKPRKLTLPVGTLTVRRARGRDLDARFESRILPLFVWRPREVSELLPELYLHGAVRSGVGCPEFTEVGCPLFSDVPVA